MKITTRACYEWDAGRTLYIKVSEESFDYIGPVMSLCGATNQQKQIGDSQQNFMTQVQSQAGTVFGNDSSVFNDLMKTFAPTVAAGPNQQGFSPAELSNLNSQAITGTGQAYKNAKAAVGNAQAASGGGNTPLPTGASIGVNTELAASAANQTANELSGITEQNYAVGRQNYNNATAGLANATNTFNSATGFDNAATNAGSAASSTANQIASQNQSWMQAASGALGAIGGAAMGGLTGGLFGGGKAPGMGAGNGASNIGSEVPGGWV